VIVVGRDHSTQSGAEMKKDGAIVNGNSLPEEYLQQEYQQEQQVEEIVEEEAIVDV
jgi:hypothetical protein